MTICVKFNEKNEAVAVCVMDLNDWVPDGWRLEEVPEGHMWDGKAIVTLKDYYANLGQNVVTPEVI
jgi:hypothetical protein